MLAVLQRVKSASVTVDGQLISSIGKGLLIFAAVGKDDTKKEVESMANKILKVRLWDDDEGRKWKHNVQDVKGEVLCGKSSSLSQGFHNELWLLRIPYRTCLLTLYPWNSLPIHAARFNKEGQQARLSQVRKTKCSQGALRSFLRTNAESLPARAGQKWSVPGHDGRSTSQ